MVKYSNRHFTKEDIQVVKKQMKKCSISLFPRKMQIKAIMKYLYLPRRISKIDTTKCGHNVEQREHLPPLVEVNTGTTT